MKVKPTLLVLAAGLGSRYGSLKQIDKLGPNGETIIDYSLYDAIKAGFGKVIFIIRESIEDEFKAVMLNKFADKIAIDYALQELDKLPQGCNVPGNRSKPWGTAHAVWVAGPKIKEPFAVINGDDFYGFQSFKIMADFLGSKPHECGLIGYQLGNTLSDHGAVSRGICDVNEKGYLVSITEQVNIAKTASGIVALNDNNTETLLSPDQIVSMNLMGFPPNVLPYFEKYLKEFIEKNAHNPKAEFFLPDVVDKLNQTGAAKVNVLRSPEKWFGITYPNDKPVAVSALQDLVDKGVYPEHLWNTTLEEVK